MFVMQMAQFRITYAAGATRKSQPPGSQPLTSTHSQNKQHQV